MQRRADFAHVTWDEAIDVPVITLDSLIAQHGVPVFCKIDVEGFEHAVLQGLIADPHAFAGVHARRHPVFVGLYRPAMRIG
ncbi:MAG: FkbM family methyltransferase [Caldilineaceae bacterium]